jgi:hypothetical protein
VHRRDGGRRRLREARRWRILENTDEVGDLWGATTFRKRVYVSGDEGVFLLNEADGTLERVDLGLGEDFTTSYLDANDGVMWSVGPKLARTSDGKTWEKIEESE